MSFWSPLFTPQPKRISGALVEAKEAGGYTPLTRATLKQRTDVMVLLKLSGAECQTADVTSKAVHSLCVAAGS